MTEQEFRKLVVYSMGVLAEQDVMHQVSFQLLDGHNDGLLRLQRGYKSNARICLSTGAVSPGDVAFVGDTIFKGSRGNDQYPGGNGVQLIRSIRQKVLTLSDQTVLLSGHSDETTVGAEKRYY